MGGVSLDKLKVFPGTASRQLTESVCRYLGLPVGKAIVSHFPNTETLVKVEEDVRGCDAYVIQSTCAPTDHNVMELLLYIDCLKRASAHRITAVIPHFGYARQDRKDEGRVPISAKLVANLITTAGADRVLTIDLHASQIQGFFDIPVDHLYAFPVISEYYESLHLPDLLFVSPDVGSLKMARAYAKHFNCGMAVVDKERRNAETVEAMFIIGEVADKNVVIADDVIVTAGSICAAAGAVMDAGARAVYLGATHGAFCGPAFERLATSPIKEIVVTDTIPLPEDTGQVEVKVLSVAPLLGEAIKRIHMNESVSSLFQDF